LSTSFYTSPKEKETPGTTLPNNSCLNEGLGPGQDARAGMNLSCHPGGNYYWEGGQPEILLMEGIRLTNWDVKIPVNDEINYQPQLASRMFSINSIMQSPLRKRRGG